MVFPPVRSPRIILASGFANKKHNKNATREKIYTIFLLIRYISFFLSYSFKVSYSLVILLIASGIPAEEIIKNIL